MAKKDVACKLKYYYPRKGSLIKIFDALVEGGVHKDLVCRVLSVEGKKVRVLVMNYNIPATKWYDKEADKQYTEIRISDTSLRKITNYAGSKLDTALNTTLYNKMTTRMKKSIYASPIYQKVYTASTWWEPVSNPDFIIKALRPNPPEQATSVNQPWKDTGSYVYIGNRYIFPMGIEDIKKYFNPQVGATIKGQDVNWLLFNATDPTPLYKDTKMLWFRSTSLSGEGGASPNYAYYYEPDAEFSYYGAFPGVDSLSKFRSTITMDLNLRKLDWLPVNSII